MTNSPYYQPRPYAPSAFDSLPADGAYGRGW